MNESEPSSVVAIAAVVVTAIVAIFAALQWSTARANARLVRVQLLISLKQEWQGLRHDWAIALMLTLGPGGFYVEVPMSKRHLFAALLEFDNDGDFRGLTRGDRAYLFEFAPSDEERARVRSMSDEERRLRAHDFLSSVERILDYLHLTCGRVLSGEVPVAVLYEAFGPYVIQNARSLRTLTGKHRYSYYFPGHPERVLALTDILWAHAICVRDVSTQAATQLADHKRKTGSGAANRKRIRRLSSAHGGAFMALRMEYLLCFAETRKRSRAERLYCLIKGRTYSLRDRIQEWRRDRGSVGYSNGRDDM